MPYRLTIGVFAVWGLMTGVAAAQTASQEGIPSSSLASVSSRVPSGDIVYVTDASGAIVEGRLRAVTSDNLRLSIGKAIRDMPAASVRRIDWRKPDSPLTGVLIGAGLASIHGIYWLIVDPNECSNTLCPEEYAFIAAGAVAGGLIDRAIRKRVTVYLAGASTQSRVTVAPSFTSSRKGLHVALKF